MRKFLQIQLDTRSTEAVPLSGEEIIRGGRHLIARTLLDEGIAGVDPLSPANPLLFSAGPFAGTNFSNANRLSVGCKSPLTGGVKESNAGGTFSLALGHLEIAGLTLRGASAEWVVIHLAETGEVRFDDARPYLGLGNNEAARRLHAHYGDKTSLALCGPVGEYQGLVAGIAVSDAENRPSRIAARGGVGAVMGAKRVKAIVVDKRKMPPLHDRKKVMASVRDYGRRLREQTHVQTFSNYGTASVADLTNRMGALPVRNFSVGQLVDPGVETFEAGGDHIYDRNSERGGSVSHACMPGCQIQCSNVYVDADGKEIVSPLEYETIGLLGTNCGLTDPDDIARLNAIANDLGVDTIEVGATLAVLMEAGHAPFGDVAFMTAALEDLRQGDERGRLLALGTARVGEHFGVERIPVIKKQAISAYDPRVIEVTGISMMVTAQGADHTTGNLPSYDCEGKSIEELAEQSFAIQVHCAIADSLGICVFGRSVNNSHWDLIADAINSAHGTAIDDHFLFEMGRETLRLEKAFNDAAGFGEADDELPAFFYTEPLAPTGKRARLHSDEVNRCVAAARDTHSAG